MRVKEKVFGYWILVHEAKSNGQTNGNTADDGHPFIYTIVDLDGDGKFEALLTHDELRVPIWAVDGI